MSKSSPDEEPLSIECDLEFDAPQWVDLEMERERSQNDFWTQDSVSDLHASWFQEVHPLHDIQVDNPTKPGISRTRQKMDASKTGVFQPKRNSSLTKHFPSSTTLLPGRCSNDSMSSALLPSRCSNDSMSSALLPSRCSNDNMSTALLPSRCSNDSMNESPKPRLSRIISSTHTISHPAANAPVSPLKNTLKTKAKTTNPIPQKNAPKTREKENPKCTLNDKVVASTAGELHTATGTTTKESQPNRTFPKKYAKYDENGRRIHKGSPTTCPAPTKTQLNSLTSQVRLKGKRRSANDIRPLGNKEAKQKRRSCFPLSSSTKETSPKLPNQLTTASKPTLSKTLDMKSKKSVVPKSFKATTQKPTTQKPATQKPTTQKPATQKPATQKQTDDLNETENEIRELIAQHNSRIAARRAKMNKI